MTVLKAEGHSADTGAGKFPLVSMGGQAEGLACADPGARTPIGASGIFFIVIVGLGPLHINDKQEVNFSNFNST